MDVLFSGLDVSTQGSKLVIIDWTNKSVLHVDSVQYDRDLPFYGTENGIIPNENKGISESDPLMWIAAVELLLERANKDSIPLKNVKAISVSGQQHGLVALDKDGKLSRPTSKLWNDFSTQEECDLLTKKVGGQDQMISEIGNTQRTGYTASKIYNMFRHEKDAYDITETFLLVHNYINWYLTGGIAVMEPGDTSGTALWNPIKQTWSNNVISNISEDLKLKLPHVKPATQSIGLISSAIAKRFGFSPECKIGAGSGDNMYGAVGTGNIKPGIVTVSLGTSGTAYTFMKKPYVDQDGEIACFCDSTGHYLPLLCVSNMANGYNDFLRMHSLSHTQFDELISFTVPGNKGNLLIPWFEGERTPDLPQAAPLYFGFKQGDFDQKYLARALLEGHIHNLYDGFRKLPAKPEIIHLTGGLAQSPSWCQAIADIFNCETVPVKGEGAAMGAALHAAWIWKMDKGYDTKINYVVNNFMQFDESLRRKPQSKYQDIYQKQKELYHAFSSRVRGIKSRDPFQLRSLLMDAKSKII